VIIGVYAVGSAICHQLPERSMHLWRAQMPVCARCTGIYFGAVIGATAAALSRRAAASALGASARLRHLHASSPAWVRAALLTAVAPTLATLFFEWTTGIMPPHAIRAAAGLLIGVVVAWLVVAAADNQVN
jgi:hypothetical protein